MGVGASNNICFLSELAEDNFNETDETKIFCQQLKHKGWGPSVFTKSMEESLF